MSEVKCLVHPRYMGKTKKKEWSTDENCRCREIYDLMHPTFKVAIEIIGGCSNSCKTEGKKEIITVKNGTDHNDVFKAIQLGIGTCVRVYEVTEKGEIGGYKFTIGPVYRVSWSPGGMSLSIVARDYLAVKDPTATGDGFLPKIVG
jgi:hypothetical protein